MDPDFFEASWNLFETSPHHVAAATIHDNHDDGEGNEDSCDSAFYDTDAFSNDKIRKQNVSSVIVHTLSQAMNFLSTLSLSFEELFNIKQVENIITQFMGNMAQCRIHGKEIRELRGNSSLMTILYNLICKWEGFRQKDVSDECLENGGEMCELDGAKYREENKLASAILGALRDLSCGDATTRLQIGQFDAIMDNDIQESYDVTEMSPKHRTGIDIISYFVLKYKYMTWDDIPTQELKTMTNALGVARNITHSTPFNCRAFHDAGMTKVFIHRLVGRFHELSEENVKSVEPCRELPSSSEPWREACYRLAGTLINMAEKCQDAAVECAKDEDLIWILIESWGGVKDWNSFFYTGNLKKAIPVLHVGLVAVLGEKIKLEGLTDGLVVKEHVSTKENVSGQSPTSHVDDEKTSCKNFHIMDVIMCIMENEKWRKRAAQQRESQRKTTANHATKSYTE